MVWKSGLASARVLLVIILTNMSSCLQGRQQGARSTPNLYNPFASDEACASASARPFPLRSSCFADLIPSPCPFSASLVSTPSALASCSLLSRSPSFPLHLPVRISLPPLYFRSADLRLHPWPPSSPRFLAGLPAPRPVHRYRSPPPLQSRRVLFNASHGGCPPGADVEVLDGGVEESLKDIELKGVAVAVAPHPRGNGFCHRHSMPDAPRKAEGTRREEGTGPRVEGFSGTSPPHAT